MYNYPETVHTGFGATMNNSVKKLLDTLRRRLEEPFSAITKPLEANPGIRWLIKQANRGQRFIRAVLGPIRKLRRGGPLDMTPSLGSEARRMRNTAGNIERDFRLPEIVELPKLFREFESGDAANAIKRYREEGSELRRAMESMRTPWLDVEHKLASVAGFVELQCIGHALRTGPAFDPLLTDALRVDLGDWRDKITWPSDIFTDPSARTSFYLERGFDPALTAFPPEAFEESASIAGLKELPPPLVQAYNFEAQEEEEEEESAFKRTNKAHDRLQRFETQLRRFIDERMKAAFGENWIKPKVPGDISEWWLEKQKKAEDDGGPEWPLIAYADFTDYVVIIMRKDNWNKVFRPVFKRPAFVQESFQRLYPIRVCTMHARPITQDDKLYLYVETKRILDAIGVVI